MTYHKNLPKINIHPILLIFILISFITGTFMELSIILAIVFIHELGHFIMARIFNWRIHSIMLWVFGGVMKTEEHGNRSLFEEALVIIAGPFQHVLIYIVVQLLLMGNLLPVSVVEMILFYNLMILIFNLLPIWPLDGGKLLFILLCYSLPFQKSYHITIIFSLIASVTFILLHFLFFSFTLSFFLILLFLCMENRTEWKQRYFVFIRFLLNRYKGDLPIKKVHPITVPHHSSLMDIFIHFHRDRKHPIYITFANHHRKAIDEIDCLHYYFNDKKYQQTIGELVKDVV